MMYCTIGLVLTYGSTPRCGVAISATECGAPKTVYGRSPFYHNLAITGRRECGS